ncbi:MAG: hypothetical protein JWL75_245 [Parcubacteria group bacterium]|nr:hypothetical protein [Parcubacteria group bacterium]
MPAKKYQPLIHRIAPYSFVVTIPDRIFPFASLVNGKKVRWRRSYEKRLADIQKQFGAGRYGMKLGVYREVCHLLGAAIFILLATVLSKILLGNETAVPALFVFAMIVITYQEFILQPRTNNQHLGKGIADWISWMVPIGMYAFLYVVH